MADFDRPTFNAILARVKTDVDSRTGGSAFFPKSVELALAFVLSKASDGNHAHADRLLQEILPTTCGYERLLQWAEALGVTVVTATQATRVCTFTGTGTPTIPLGWALTTEDGTTFTVTVAGTLAGGTTDVTATADDAGTGGNIDPGATISLVNPISGVVTDGVIADDAGNVDAVDDESVESLRNRVLYRLSNGAPSGGGIGDYVTWALEVPGVTRAWEFAKRLGPGTVSLSFVRDGDTPSIIPDASEVSEVQDYVDSKKPLDMLAFYAVAPIARVVDMTIALIPNTAAVRAAAQAQLEDTFRENAGVEVAGPTASKINEAISVAAGEDDHEVTLIDGTTLALFDPDPGVFGINVLGTVTWV